MSSINTGYDGYAIKHLSDYEDELKRDSQATQARAREQADELSKAYEESIRKNQEKSDAAVEDMRTTYQEKYEKSRERDREEMDRMTRQHYDRFGRDRSNEADQAKQQLRDYVRSSEAERDANRRAIKQAESDGENRNHELSKQFEDRLTRAVEDQRRSASASFEELAVKNKSAAEAYGEEATKRYEELNRNRMAEQAESRNRTQTVLQDSQRDMDNLKRHVDDSVEQRLSKASDATKVRLEENARVTRNSQDKENAQLRAQIRDLIAAEGDYVKDRAQARTDVIREQDDDVRAATRRVQEAHEQEVRKLNEQAALSEDHATRASSDNGRERESQFAHMLAKKQVEAHEDLRDVTNRYESAFKETEVRERKDRAYAQKQVEQLAHDLNDQRQAALDKQAQTYQETMTVQQAHAQDKIDNLQRELKKKNTPEDSMDVSPAVEAVVRRSIVKQYEKNLSAEIDRNKRENDSLQTSYKDKISNLNDEHANVLTARHQSHEAERHQEAVLFADHVQDTETQRDLALRSQASDHDRQTDTLTRSYTQSAMKQRAEYESMIQTLRDDASNRMQAQRQESDFAMKAQQRSFSVRQNEVIREYESKLADQKQDYETRLDNLKTENAQKLRDVERRDKQLFDESVRGYEQRLSVAEDQRKERERIIAQNYQDELDKVRRSNALLQSKKG